MHQVMHGTLEGFLRRGTPKQRHAVTAYISKNTSNVKLALGIDDILIGFFYVVNRKGVVHASGRCDEHNVEVMVAAVEEAVAAEGAAQETAEAAAAKREQEQEAAWEERKKRGLDAAAIVALKAKASQRLGGGSGKDNKGEEEEGQQPQQ